ncbi:sigma-70 family RNA polymerase sigma factor [Tautonia plasticadhaerens]|nr:sigma-70 family RNA polymerase sigma factor [Tautonia plasticadhaerens]
MMADERDDAELVLLASGGDHAALASLFARHRGRLRQVVRLRMDRRLQGRVDPSDVLQEAYLDLAEKLPEFEKKRGAMPFFLWLRLVTIERLLRVHRRHLGAAMRAADREISLHRGALPHASSASLAAQLMGRVTSVSRAAARAELRVLLEGVLERLPPSDREIITLRHFEELSNEEAAALLGLNASAASKRYVRAMLRLKDSLAAIPAFSGSARGLLG